MWLKSIYHVTQTTLPCHAIKIRFCNFKLPLLRRFISTNQLSAESGLLSISNSEKNAEQELLTFLPEFQSAQSLTATSNTTRAIKILPLIERVTDICRSSMASQPFYLAVALRHLGIANMRAGKYDTAFQCFHERGAVLNWSMNEKERIIHYFLQLNDPIKAKKWLKQHEVEWTMSSEVSWRLYTSIVHIMEHGPEDLQIDDIDGMIDRLNKDKSASVLDLTHYAALCYEKSGQTNLESSKESTNLSTLQYEYLDKAESWWLKALENSSIPMNLEAHILLNIGELLLNHPDKKVEDAMEYIGKGYERKNKLLEDKSLPFRYDQLFLLRSLRNIATGSHRLGQAVTSEGLFRTVIESYEKEKELTTTQKMEYVIALRNYGSLLSNWEKRERDATIHNDKADSMEKELLQKYMEMKCQKPISSTFYIPVE